MASFTFVLLILDATLRVSAPLILAALAGLLSERSGVFDISLEGKMLAAAFAAASVAYVADSPWAGLLAGIAASVAFALLHGFACITHRGNQIVSGLAINILVAGLTSVAGRALFAQGGRTPQLPTEARFMPLTLPGADAAAGGSVLGTIYSELLSGHNLLVYVAFLSVPAVAFVIYRTRFGLRLRAVGENPEAVDTAGISVTRLRYQAVILCGVLCGVAGAYLSTAQSAAFIKDMTAGKGYIALAALIFGKWRPLPTLLACLLFGFLEAAAARLQGSYDINRLSGALREAAKALPFVIEALPYILVVLLLAGFVGTAVAPRAGGIPYVKER